MNPCNIAEWTRRGVQMGGEVDLARIASNAVIHAGSHIRGSTTAIGPDCVIGAEAPVVLENCQLGRGVKLAGGFFSKAVFFDGANMGSGAHVRAGTILEEEANGAHTVGLKQTILLPFVTLGSLINFCDVLMAGGTSRRNHSEVGSSYIHFNFTPHQDKATASLIGDVPRGVFLNQQPIFLGGQGGLVGPARIEYGSVIAAGGVARADLTEENKLYIPPVPSPGIRSYETGVYRKIDRIVRNNLIYMGNILALREWYREVRSRYMQQDSFAAYCLAGGLKNIDLILAERIKRLGDLAEKMDASIEGLKKQNAPHTLIEEQHHFRSHWISLKAQLEGAQPVSDERVRERFLASLPAEGNYIETMQSMEEGPRELGQQWLQSIVDRIAQLWR